MTTTETKTFKLTLTTDRVEVLSRFAAVLGLTWQQYLQREIEEKILSEGIGSPLIKGPSFSKNKITGPSKQ